MLTQTFIHIQGIGYATERRLWELGARTWEAFLAIRPQPRLPLSRAEDLPAAVAASLERLAAGDHRFFARRLPSRDHWRALPEFGERILFLDIETDGGTEIDSVTVIGAHDGRQLHQFVRGQNLLDFPDLADQAQLLVTFFGSGFDLPLLRRAFPRLPLDQLHVDLCYALRRLGHRGGLKAIEREIGLARSADTAGLNGWDAVRLWQEYRWGREDSLTTLRRYNAEDVENMRPLLAYAYERLRARALGEAWEECDIRNAERGM
ncbi:MAG: ribonuclease H-like domain-containing protein [Armatimonadetes bacterium]|nr:ribonuclease H-like domain-containing protein [Armatimonadota bacterium]